MSGNTATYADVYPGVDLTLSATRTGYAMNYVIKTKPADAAGATSLVAQLGQPLALTVTGLTIGRGNDGSLSFTDTKGTVVGFGRAPRMWDASPNAAASVADVPSRTAARGS